MEIVRKIISSLPLIFLWLLWVFVSGFIANSLHWNMKWSIMSVFFVIIYVFVASAVLYVFARLYIIGLEKKQKRLNLAMCISSWLLVSLGIWWIFRLPFLQALVLPIFTFVFIILSTIVLVHGLIPALRKGNRDVVP